MKEITINNSVEVYKSSMENAIKDIAQKAYEAGFNEGYAQAKTDLNNSTSRIVNINGIDYHDIGMSDGSLIGFLEEELTFFEASLYSIPTVEQIKEIKERTRCSRGRLIFPDGYTLDVQDNDFFWCKDCVDEQSEVQGLGISVYSYGQSITWQMGLRHGFTGYTCRVIVVKNI